LKYLQGARDEDKEREKGQVRGERSGERIKGGTGSGRIWTEGRGKANRKVS
jgi:hypothetical protein